MINPLLKNILLNTCASFAILSAASAQVIVSGAPNPTYANLITWLNAEAGVINGGNGTAVTLWHDQSNQGNDATPRSGAGNAPTFVSASALFNGQPVIDFNGASQGFTLTNATGILSGSSQTIFIVASFDAIASVQVMLAEQASFLFESGGAFELQRGATGFQTITSSSSAVAVNTPYIFAVSRSGTAAGQTDLLINDTQNDNGTAIPAMPASSNGTIGWQGYNTSGGATAQRYLNGQIAEILVYNTVLSQSDYDGVMGYLSNKYNIVPEPSTLYSLLVATVGLVVMFRRRRGSIGG